MVVPFTRAGIGIYIEMRRQDLRLSRKQLAQQLGLTETRYRRLTHGQIEPTDAVLEFLEIDRTKVGYVMRVA